MGIYSTRIPYGLRILQKNCFENCPLYEEYITCFEEISHPNQMDPKVIKTEIEKYIDGRTGFRFHIYIECSTSYDVEDPPFMIWEHINLNDLMELVK